MVRTINEIQVTGLTKCAYLDIIYGVKGVFFEDHIDKLYATFLVVGNVFY